MRAEFIEYRNQHMVIPFLDWVSYPDGYEDNNVPSPIYSKWAINSKPSGNLDKGAMAGHIAGSALSIGLAALSLGMGTGGAMADLSNAANKAGKAIDTASASNMAALSEVTKNIAKHEHDHWMIYYNLLTFVPAQGNLGDVRVGASSEYGKDCHCFYENGDYFEGLLYNTGDRMGIFINADGSRYYGTIKNGMKESLGVEIAPDGSRIFGMFKNGQLSWGCFECEACAMIGNWSNGVLHGNGGARYADGNAFVGDWINGQPVA